MQESLPAPQPPSSRKVLRRVDLLLLPLLTACFGLQFYDKAALGSAAIFGILDDLSLVVLEPNPNGGAPIRNLSRYSNATAAFYYGYVAAVVPAALLAQRFKVNYFLGACITLWGIITLLTPAVSNWQGLIVQRVFLGIIESTVSPGFLLVTRRWYTKAEMPMRVGIWYSATGLFSILSGLVAYGLGTRQHDIATWKTLFLVPGALTVFFGFCVLLVLPPSPEEDPVLRIPGYNVFDEEDRDVILAKTRSEMLGRERSRWSWRQVLEALLDIKVWIYFFMAISIYVCNGGVTVFGSILLRSIGYTPTRAILLQTPGGATTVVLILIVCLLSARFPNSRLILLAMSCIPVIIGAAMIWSPTTNWQTSKGVPLAGYYLLPIFGAPYVMLLASLAANVGGSTKASFASGAVFVGYNVGNIAASYILVASEAAQHYPTTWKVIIAMMVITMGLAAILAAIFVFENRARDKRASGAAVAVESSGREERQIDQDDVHDEEVKSNQTLEEATEIEAQDLTDKQNRKYRYVL